MVCSVMTRSLSRLSLGAAMLLLGSTVVSAQSNPRGEASLDGGKVRIDYGRPAAKGRDLMEMVRSDFYWRMGADTATLIMTQVDLEVAGKLIPKGEYTLLGYFKTKEAFELVFAREVAAGTREPTDEAARVEGKIEAVDSTVERLTIDLERDGDDVTFVLSWGGTRITAPLKIRS